MDLWANILPHSFKLIPSHTTIEPYLVMAENGPIFLLTVRLEKQTLILKKSF